MKTKISSILILSFALLMPLFSFSQKLKPTKERCLVEISLTDFDGYPIIYAYLTITTNPSGEKVYVQTNRTGKAEVLIPKTGNKTYEIEVNYRNDVFKFDRLFSIPQDEGAYVLSANLKYQSKYVVLYEVEFQSNKATMLPNSFKELNRVVEMMVTKPTMKIEVSGHTDSIGSLQYNLDLSQKRAYTVKNYLVQQNIEAERVSAVGLGPKEPIGDNQTEDGRKRNRRIEIRITEE